MNQNTLPSPKFELPEPQAKTGKEGLAPLEGDQDVTKATEQRNTEMPGAPTSAPISTSQATQSVAAADPAGAASLLPSLAPAQAPAIADADLPAEDSDLIEKAWVQKAKAIVEKTRDDPYKQNAEINKVKKDYIQKRYHKDVKLNDE